MIDFEFEFQYAEEKALVLRQTVGSIPKGRCVVLCDGSGCGKSTLPGTVFSFMLVLFPQIIAIGIAMRTLIGRSEASRTLAALHNMHLPERLIGILLSARYWQRPPLPS